MIVQDEKFLRTTSEDVQHTEVDTIFQTLLAEVKLHSDAAGLSAIQIGIPKRIFITLDKKIDEWKVWINPTLDSHTSETISMIEGCLSFPDRSVKTIRHQQITVTNFVKLSDGSLVPEKFVLTEIDAVVFQHELDHLNGMLMFDRGFELYLPVAESTLPGRNETCHCGSGKKFKKCCGK